MLRPEILVKARLPNQQRTTVTAIPGRSVRDALAKALKLRKLEPDMCTVYKIGPDGRTKQQIGWDVDMSLLKCNDIEVEPKDKIPMHTQLSHNFAKSYLTLSKCHFCNEFLMSGIRCLTCGIEFHRNCSNNVPKLCEPAIEHSNYYRHLLARSGGFSPKSTLSTSESPTNTTWPIRPRARSADENSKQKSKAANHNSDQKSANNHNNATNPGDQQMAATTATTAAYNQNSANKSGLSSYQFATNEQQQHIQSNGQTANNSTVASSASTNQIQRSHQQLLEEKWEIEGTLIKKGKKIGQGSFAFVYKGDYYGTVALKKLHVKNPTATQLQTFKNEVAVLKKTRHPNILLFIGYVLGPELIIVTQWCKGRSLFKHLHDPKETRTFTNYEIKDIALGIAQGMEYLHAKHIIHCDLKSHNIFIHDEDNLTVKIGDFGLAIFKTRDEDGQKTYDLTGSALWMAPELIKTDRNVNPFTFQSDVYAYGIVLYELLSRKLPYFDCSPETRSGFLYLIGSGSPLLKLNLDVIGSDKPEGFKTLMLSCIERDREKRPQFTSIIKSIKSIRISRMPRATSEPLRLNDLDFSQSQTNDFI